MKKGNKVSKKVKVFGIKMENNSVLLLKYKIVLVQCSTGYLMVKEKK
jgi:hypothetical protein